LSPSNDEAEQYLCAAVLRPGNVTAAAGAVGIFASVDGLDPRSFPKTRIRDSSRRRVLQITELLAFLDGETRRRIYVMAMGQQCGD